MTPEQRAAAIAMLGGGAAGNAGMALGQRAMSGAPMTPPMQPPMPAPAQPPAPAMTQADFSGYESGGGKTPMSVAQMKKLAAMLRGAQRLP